MKKILAMILLIVFAGLLFPQSKREIVKVNDATYFWFTRDSSIIVLNSIC